MKKIRSVFILAVSALLLSAFSCNSTQVHKASDASAKISIGLKAVEKLNEDLWPAQISNEESAAISRAVNAATFANDEAVHCIQKLKSNANTGAAGCVAGLMRALEKLNNQALLGVKNADARAKLNLEFQTVETAANFIAGYFGAPPLDVKTTPLSQSNLDWRSRPAWKDPTLAWSI